MKRDLLAQASRVCAEYNQSLAARLAAADKAHADAKTKFNTSIDSIISSLTAKFNECKAKRTANIAAYKKKMEQSRGAQRAAFSAKLNKVNVSLSCYKQNTIGFKSVVILIGKHSKSLS